MGQKFVIQADPIQVGDYLLTVVGLPPLTPTSIGSLESEIDSVELPDRTHVSGFRTKPGEFEMKIPAHHHIEIAAMALWRQEAIIGSPLYKKVGTQTIYSGTRLNFRLVTILGLWCQKIADPEKEMGSEGDMAEYTYTMKYDDLLGV